MIKNLCATLRIRPRGNDTLYKSIFCNISRSFNTAVVLETGTLHNTKTPARTNNRNSALSVELNNVRNQTLRQLSASEVCYIANHGHRSTSEPQTGMLHRLQIFRLLQKPTAQILDFSTNSTLPYDFSSYLQGLFYSYLAFVCLLSTSRKNC